METPKSTAYKMKISRLTVNKLGVQLYDKASAVLAELVANGYDADARSVIIRAPMNKYLATTQNGVLTNHNFCIEVIDDGIGMTPDQVQEFYLKVGAERRTDPKRGSESGIFKRKVMGRKGVGKLAPFGICEKIELLSSGGNEVDGFDENGKPMRGFLTAHLHLDRTDILTESDSDYEPVTGKLDGTVRRSSGTILKLTNFLRKQVPSLSDLNRQLSQRFGIQSENWEILLVNTEDKPMVEVSVGSFEIETMNQTKLIFKYESESSTMLQNIKPRVFNENGDIRTEIDAGFDYEGIFYPIFGWIAYSKEPYKDDLMAGVRIYCNGKIAAQTPIFNRKAGFTGEHSIRSY